MKGFIFTEADLGLMKSLNIETARVLKQIEIFRKSSCYVNLARPCTVNDGIRTISPEDMEGYALIQRDASEEGRFTKFVPASGAATRMFQAILRFCDRSLPMTREDVKKRADDGDPFARDLLQCMEEIREFAFFDDLRESMAMDKVDLNELIGKGHFRDIMEYLVMNRGLGCGSLPKGLLKFHKYPSGCRTAFEEHLVESVHYVRDRDGNCRLHFTVSPEHEDRFRSLCDMVRPLYEKEHTVRFEITFSCQRRSTDTVAVDLSNIPFRDGDGSIVFRPGGHGALLENLNELGADLVYIKNIDNVVIDPLKEPTCSWKKVLGGYLREVEKTVHYYVRRLKTEDSPKLMEDAAAFASRELLIELPPDFALWLPEDRRSFLIGKLNRPIRVCGVVENAGEPGGAPFWTTGKEGLPSLQIVEKAQVDFSSRQQRSIWMSSTHFNPVDLVCAVRDCDGKPFDLMQFVDEEAVFISEKSINGRDLKALELPGLWNGAMSDWITIFVEVPRITFNPVKTINDLLRAEHRMAYDDYVRRTERLEWQLA